MDEETRQKPEDEKQKEEHDRKPWRLRHAYTLAALLSSVIFVASFLAVEHVRQNGFDAIVTLAGVKAVLESVAVTFSAIGVLGLLSFILGNGIASLFLSHTVKRALPYRTFMEWVGSSNEKKILNLIRLHELHVYAAGTKLLEEAENLKCRIVPLYMLPVHDTFFRWALSPFREIYFDQDELEDIFDENLDFLRRARPDRLMEEGTLSKETATKLKITLERAESRKGDKGRLATMQNLNDYYKLQAFVLTKLVLLSEEKWKNRKTEEKAVTHDKIDQMVSYIRDKHPELKKRMLELAAKNPNLPSAMKEFFRHAMPDEMVDWRNGKPTLEDLIENYTKGNRGEPQEEGTPDGNQEET